MDSLAMAIEDFNAESVHIQHDLAEYGQECNHDGELIQVDTPWAMGFVDEQATHITSVRPQFHSQYKDGSFADKQGVSLV